MTLLICQWGCFQIFTWKDVRIFLLLRPFTFPLHVNNKIISSGEDVLLWFVEAGKSTKETGQKAEAVWSD